MKSLPGSAEKKAPLSKYQARESAKEYGYLAGTTYFENGTAIGIIDCVAVVPFDDVNKYIFLEYYFDSKDPVRALDFYYAPFYDIMLVVRSYGRDTRFFAPIDTFEPVSRH